MRRRRRARLRRAANPMPGFGPRRPRPPRRRRFVRRRCRRPATTPTPASSSCAERSNSNAIAPSAVTRGTALRISPALDSRFRTVSTRMPRATEIGRRRERAAPARHGRRRRTPARRRQYRRSRRLARRALAAVATNRVMRFTTAAIGGAAVPAFLPPMTCSSICAPSKSASTPSAVRIMSPCRNARR